MLCKNNHFRHLLEQKQFIYHMVLNLNTCKNIVRPLFCHFLPNSAILRPPNFLAMDNILGLLLSYVAENSAICHQSYSRFPSSAVSYGHSAVIEAVDQIRSVGFGSSGPVTGVHIRTLLQYSMENNSQSEEKRTSRLIIFLLNSCKSCKRVNATLYYWNQAIYFLPYFITFSLCCWYVFWRCPGLRPALLPAPRWRGPGPGRPHCWRWAPGLAMRGAPPPPRCPLSRVARWPWPRPLCSKVAVENLKGPWKI
jgi:hypothetical protein